MLTWLMDEATGEETSTRSLTRRILTVNFAAIHTSTMVIIVNALESLYDQLNGPIDIIACSVLLGC
jgi:hypothetical protein